MSDTFHSPYRHGFLRVAACVPHGRLADPRTNAQHILHLARQACEQGAALALFPELSLSGYSLEDLFHQEALLDATMDGLADLVRASAGLPSLLIVGAPLRVAHQLFNCAVAIHQGRILGITPKTYLPNYREFYEKRQFITGKEASFLEISLLEQTVPFGSDLIYEASSIPGCAIHVELCEDLWVPLPPSSYAALAGATVLVNPSASNITIGKADYRRSLCASQSARCLAAYVLTASGAGESTTNLAWDGHAMIFENNVLLAESTRFAPQEQLILADVDLEHLLQERMGMTSFNDAADVHREQVAAFRRLPVPLAVPQQQMALCRPVDRFPYVPSEPAARDDRCYEAYNIQVHGLAQRLRATGIERVVIGISGGLDSTQALIVCVRTMDQLGLPRKNVMAYTMPGFATSERTRSIAWRLIRALQVTGQEIDIRPSCRQVFRDLGHPFAEGREVYDVTFENVQAGERTSHLFRLANFHQALVVGTGDLSELALGWCTYGVGDHMSHYSVNASVPKTLVRYLIGWVIRSGQLDPEANAALQAVLETEISPELVPAKRAASSSSTLSTDPTQCTEEVTGPFVLQDFALYYISRFGYRPSKVAYLAHHAWGDRTAGSWPEGIPEHERQEYSLSTIKHWLEVFLIRFFQTSQFKRSCLPDSPKVGSGGTLSPRSDWRAPSDAPATTWVDELRANVPDE